MVPVAQTTTKTSRAPRHQCRAGRLHARVGLQAKFRRQTVNVADPAVWLPSGKFWYGKTVKGGKAFETG
jgi:hypothetical protein